MVKEICERCGKVYEAGPNTHYCKECRKEIRSVAAKKRNLSDMGHAARKEKQTSERMIIDALPARNNILLGIVATNTGNAVVDAMIQGAFRACLKELDDAPKVEVQEWRRASDPPPTHNETWNDGNETYSGETSMKVWAHCADGTQHEAHYEIHDGTGQWFVEGQDDRFDEHGNVTHWMYYPAAPKD